MATVVAAVDQARVRQPGYTEEGYAEETALQYGFKEHVSARKTVEFSPERQVIVTKPIKAPEAHVATVPKIVVPVPTPVPQVRR